MISAILFAVPTIITGFFNNLTFVNFAFYCFLLLAVILYYSSPLRIRKYVLLTISIAFYATWGVVQFAFVAVASVTAYVGAILIEKTESKPKKKLVLFTSVTVMIVMLLYVKLGKLFFDAKSIIVPLGISYYTFSVIGYLADVYWGKEKSEKKFMKFLLFILYFPKILEGSIEKYRPLADRLFEGHKFDYKQFYFGLQIMVYGAFKKLVVADRLVILTNEIFGKESYVNYGGAIVIAGAIFPALQMYADFSGCMDMALGMSQALGIELRKNFNHPFFSKSAAEFWMRWHITLGVWFKD